MTNVKALPARGRSLPASGLNLYDPSAVVQYQHTGVAATVVDPGGLVVIDVRSRALPPVPPVDLTRI